jgi:hypothetical protein
MEIAPIMNAFTYHPPTKSQVIRYKQLRDAGLELALTINEQCPECADKTLAVRKVREAIMYANASIAINEEGDPG